MRKIISVTIALLLCAGVYLVAQKTKSKPKTGDPDIIVKDTGGGGPLIGGTLKKDKEGIHVTASDPKFTAKNPYITGNSVTCYEDNKSRIDLSQATKWDLSFDGKIGLWSNDKTTVNVRFKNPDDQAPNTPGDVVESQHMGSVTLTWTDGDGDQSMNHKVPVPYRIKIHYCPGGKCVDGCVFLP